MNNIRQKANTLSKFVKIERQNAFGALAPKLRDRSPQLSTENTHFRGKTMSVGGRDQTVFVFVQLRFSKS